MNWHELDQSVALIVDLAKIVTHSGTAFILGAFLILLLALKWFPGFARILRRALAYRLRNARFQKGTPWHDQAFELASWLDPPEPFRRTDHDDSTNGRHSKFNPSTHHSSYSSGHLIESPTRAYGLQEQIASNRCYQTFVGESGAETFVCKLSCDRTGDRLLVKETGIIEYLKEQSVRSTYARYFPQQIEAFRFHGRSVNVFAADPSRCFLATQIRSRFPEGLIGEHIAWMFNRMLEALGFIHRQGTIHAAILPQHLLFDTQTHGLQIVDWTHAKQIGKPLTHIPGRHRKWYPAEAIKHRSVSPATDIFMAAKVAQYLAGGDWPGLPPGHLDPHLPAPIGRFLQACLMESPNMRPNDAWELHEEFSELLEGVYGPPSFHHLVMN